jgi:ABC-type glycerol-3-phosphate transport system substrate-binding protein
VTASGASRRVLLRAAAGAALATAGCTSSQRSTQVAVVWSSAELTLFRRVLQGYPGPVQVISVGDDIDAFLRARHRAGTSPDVAILPQPGLVTEYARRGWLSPLDDSVAAPFPVAWSELLRVDGRLYGAWVKAAYKSLFWYLPSMVDVVPQTWDDLVRLVQTLSNTSGPAPLAIGAADGWLLTDWFENVLAASAPPGLYDALAGGQANWEDAAVRGALERLAEVWSIPGAFPGGARRALLTQWEESVIQVISRRAAMVFEADYAEAVVTGFQRPGGEAPRTFRFPSIGGVRPLVVGGDAAVVLHGSRGGEELVGWLTGPDAFAPWIDAGGYLSPNRGWPAARYPQALQRELVKDMQDADGLRYDLSDRLPGAFGGADGVGSWRILEDFFEAVTTPGASAASAAASTARQLARAARDVAGNK